MYSVDITHIRHNVDGQKLGLMCQIDVHQLDEIKIDLFTQSFGVFVQRGKAVIFCMVLNS